MADTRVRTPSPAGVPRRLKPRKTPAQARSKALVEAVVEAGARILVERGWDGLTMQEVAAVAGVSPGSLYQYFPDKASLVTELVERQSTRELEFHLARFAELPEDASLEETLDLLVDSLVEFQAREGPLMRRSLDALQHLGRYGLLRERAARAAGVLGGLLARHAARLEPGLDLELATHVLANAIHSLTHDGVLPRPAGLDDATLKRAVRRLVLGYLGLGG
jgi:AcrR family transcriptional regulator